MPIRVGREFAQELSTPVAENVVKPALSRPQALPQSRQQPALTDVELEDLKLLRVAWWANQTDLPIHGICI